MALRRRSVIAAIKWWEEDKVEFVTEVRVELDGGFGAVVLVKTVDVVIHDFAQGLLFGVGEVFHELNIARFGSEVKGVNRLE